MTSVMPERNETMANFGGSELGAWIDPRPDDSTMGPQGRSRARRLYARLRRGGGRGALERLIRQPLVVFAQAPCGVAWRKRPSTYVVCAEDLATPPEAQREYAKREDRVVESPTGHHPMLSRPDLLAQVLAEAAMPDA